MDGAEDLLARCLCRTCREPVVSSRDRRCGRGTARRRAAEILHAALTRLAATARLRIHAEVITETELASGQKLQYPGKLEIAVRRPDRLWYKLDGEQRRIAAWYDGKSFTLLDNEKNVCASTAVPPGLGPLFDDMSARLKFRPPLSVLRAASARLAGPLGCAWECAEQVAAL